MVPSPFLRKESADLNYFDHCAFPEAKAKGNVELKSGVKAPTLCLGVLVSVKSQRESFAYACFSKEKA